LIHLPLSSIGTVAPPLTSIGGIVGEHLYHESPFLSASIPPGKKTTKQKQNNKNKQNKQTQKSAARPCVETSPISRLSLFGFHAMNIFSRTEVSGKCCWHC
jgi:hypothetical protein